MPFVNELLARGEVVHHIPPNLTSQYRARLSRKKNDVVDAQNAARALMANPSLPTFCPGQFQRELQDLTRTQRRLSEQLKANKMALQALDAGSSVRPALMQVIQVLEEQLAELSKHMKTLVKASAPTLLEILGVGPVVASVILGEVGTSSDLQMKASSPVIAVLLQSSGVVARTVGCNSTMAATAA